MKAKWMIGMAILVPWAGSARAQNQVTPVQYEVRFENAVHHEAQITVTYSDVGTAPLRLQMARSSPGRYAIHEFAKNVYSVSATDGGGRPVALSRTDPYGWTVAGHNGTVRVTYTLFADRADGTYSQIDATHAHLNMPATLMWAQGFDERPIEVRFRPYDSSWKIATQLPRGQEPNSFRAPNLQYLMDSPVELSNHSVREWPVSDRDGRYTIRLAVHHEGTEEEVDRFAEKAGKVVREQIALFGDVPNFDFGSYTFLADYLPHVAGDGMEHRNSTVLTDERSLREADFKQINTLSHEFIHAWNVERLRPTELEPFDFTRANPTPSLWFAEGFTSYYGPLTVHRAGESSLDAFLQNLSGALNYVFNTTGRHYGSPEEMSLRAPFNDAATSIDPTNPNIFTSYYTYGAVLALGLDLTLRQRFRNLSLDSWMRHLWKSHGVPERSYTSADLRNSLAAVTGSPGFADQFFQKSIKSNSLPDFEPLLAQAGLKLRRKNAQQAYAGRSDVKVEGTKVTLARATVPGTPFYLAGLEQGDQIVSLSGVRISSQEDWDTALARHAAGAEVDIEFVQRGQSKRAEVRFAPDPTLEVVTYEAAGLPLTAAHRKFRRAWLASQVKRAYRLSK